MRNTKNLLVIAKPFQCVPATLESVLRYHNIFDINQDDICQYFTLHIPYSYEYIDNKNFIYTDNESEYGVVLNTGSINSVFKQLRVPLTEKYIPITNFIDDYFFAQFIKDNMSPSTCFVCGYNYSVLFDISYKSFGHVSMICDVDINNNTIDILDPGPKDSGIKTVSAERLFNAIRKKNDGLWIITKD